MVREVGCANDVTEIRNKCFSALHRLWIDIVFNLVFQVV